MRLEDELRRALEEEVSGVGSSEEAWRSIEHRLGRESSGRPGSRIAVMALALTLSAASLTGLWLGFRSGPVDRSNREGTAGEPVDLQPRVTAVIPVGPYPADVAVGEGAVWVSVPAQGPSQDDLVVRVDPGTNEVVARIPVEGYYVVEIAAGVGGVWVVGAQGTGPDPSFHVDRIDPATNEVVARIPDVSGPLVVGEGALWAVDRAGARAGPEGSNLLRIDPATNQIVARIALGIAAWDVEFGEGYVWVLSLEPGPGEGDILQVDPATSEVVARIEIPIPGSVFAPAVGDGSAWVPVCCVDNELMLVRVDVGTSQIVGEPIRLPAGAPFAVAAGHVWTVAERGALYGLNVATQEVDEMVSGFGWPAGVSIDPSAEHDPGRLVVWVVNYRDSVTRIDLAATGTPSAESDGLCNEQISKDPDCPETIWLTEVLWAAGFEAIDDPLGQTLVGRGGGTRFFIYTDDSGDPLEGYAWPVHSTVDGVPVYRGGGPPGTLVWRAQGLDVRISPYGGDVIPSQQGVETLVRATFSVPYPPSE